MLALALPALTLLQIQFPFTPFPTRAYQPALVDPGLHGGRPRFDGDQDGHPGDVTPDGKVIVFYRKVWDSDVGLNGLYMSALQVATFDPERIQADGAHLDAFFTPGLTTTQIGGETMWGTEYAVTPVTDQEDAVADDAWLVHFSPHTLPAPDPKCPSCPTLDLDYLPDGSSNATLTLALQSLVGHPGGGANPFPSDELGDYDRSGEFRTYELWMVTTHFAVDPDDVTCPNLSNTQWQCHFGRWRFRGNGRALEPILGSRELQVIVDHSVQPPRVHSATIGDFVPLTIGATSTHIIGTEPTITADGRLLVYHGDGGPNTETLGMITYVYNDDPCQPGGWRAPRSITALHEDAHVGTGDADLLRYPLSWFPIQQPSSNGTTMHTYTEDDTLSGPYPWIDKDGSFLMSAHTFSWEGHIIRDDPGTPVFDPRNGRATRSNLVAFGAITGGHIKHVDDVALNPTRQGGNIDWPLTGESAHDVQRDSQTTTFFSTGPRPGIWEPFFGKRVPVPSMEAGNRIPVLPVWMHRTRLYGEVRFEEADGDYLLYLAGNESLRRNGNPVFSGVVDPTRTPDTSGRATRAVCTLQGGASFPQEVYGTIEDDPGFDQVTLDVDRLNAEALRLALSPVPGLQYHENIGFKGQAILFPTAGSIAIAGGPLYGGTQSPYGATGSKVSVQLFVKALRSWSSQTLRLVTDTGHFQLDLRSSGKFKAQVTVVNNGVTTTKSVESRIDAIDGQTDELDPTAGWRHVALVFDGANNGQSSLRLYVEGLKEASLNWNGESHFQGPTTDLYVGPRISGGGTDAAQAVLVLDEVAISGVVRGQAEIRRDAFVAPLPDGFENAWPPMADHPIPAEWVEHVAWPEDVDYHADKVDLGRDLFADSILSAPGSRLDTDPSTPISCATCHEPGGGFAESLETAGSSAVGISALFNTPTVLSSAFGKHKMFNGRAASLEAQVVLPLTSGSEMGTQTMAQVLTRLAGSSYHARFQALYGAGATEDTLSEVLAMYQRTLISTGAPFDAAAGFYMYSAEQRGRALFFGKARCASCHRGPAFTDDDFHNIQSVTEDELRDLGERTGRATDDGKLKTPTLRNIAATAPYFHDGSQATLEDVIEHYAGGFLDVVDPVGTPDRQLLPIELTAAEKADLREFLAALSGSNPQ